MSYETPTYDFCFNIYYVKLSKLRSTLWSKRRGNRHNQFPNEYIISNAHFPATELDINGRLLRERGFISLDVGHESHKALNCDFNQE